MRLLPLPGSSGLSSGANAGRFWLRLCGSGWRISPDGRRFTSRRKRWKSGKRQAPAIDRYLKKDREALRLKGKSLAKPLASLKSRIPIRAFYSGESKHWVVQDAPEQGSKMEDAGTMGEVRGTGKNGCCAPGQRAYGTPPGDSVKPPFVRFGLNALLRRNRPMPLLRVRLVRLRVRFGLWSADTGRYVSRRLSPSCVWAPTNRFCRISYTATRSYVPLFSKIFRKNCSFPPP
jgi:hypothetical protein